MEYITNFMLLPEIYRYAAEFGAVKEDIEFTQGEREIWLSFEKDGERVGLINMTCETGPMCEFHPYILKKSSADFDRMIVEFFEWFDINMHEQATKLNCYIAKMYKATTAAARRAGMTLEGTDRGSFLTKYGPCDRLMFGITRGEIWQKH